MATKAQMAEELERVKQRLVEAQARDYNTCDINDALDCIEDRIIDQADDIRREAEEMERRASVLEDAADNIVSARHDMRDYL